LDYIKDLVPVIHLTSNPVILSVHSSLGVNSFDELIRAAKMQPALVEVQLQQYLQS
jgi:tripartite-type tricarboxylate transporter receptor subunit TctC